MREFVYYDVKLLDLISDEHCIRSKLFFAVAAVTERRGVLARKRFFFIQMKFQKNY